METYCNKLPVGFTQETPSRQLASRSSAALADAPRVSRTSRPGEACATQPSRRRPLQRPLSFAGKHTQELAQFAGHLCLAFDGLADFGPQPFAVARPQTGDLAAQSGRRYAETLGQIGISR